MVVKLNNGAVREIKKAEPIVEKRFTFNGDTLRMVAKANSSKEDITGILFKLKDGRDDDISVFAVNEDAVLVGNLQYSEVQRILDMHLFQLLVTDCHSATQYQVHLYRSLHQYFYCQFFYQHIYIRYIFLHMIIYRLSILCNLCIQRHSVHTYNMPLSS